MKTLVLSLFAGLLALGVPPAPAHAEAPHADAGKRSSKRKARASTHEVRRGESLWTISRAHGCTLEEITRANGLTMEAMIRLGQKLRIPTCKGPRRSARAARASSAVRHVVVRGDTLGRIARQYDTSVASIQKRNRIRGNLIRPGQELVVIPGKNGRGRPIVGQSRGYPHRGKLVKGLQLPRSRHYHRRRPYRAWGTTQLIHHIKRAAAVVADRYKVHTLAIGDISAKKGGHLAPHISHQSGRDIDVGFYFRKKPKGYPRSFIVGTKRNLHMKANWLLLKTLYNTRDQPGGVSRIFLDTKLQKLYYTWARDRGVSRALLDKMFQYPRGGGFIRHESGHDDHYHVRFKCPPRDTGCHKD